MLTRRRFLLTLPAVAALPRLALSPRKPSPSTIPSKRSRQRRRRPASSTSAPTLPRASPRASISPASTPSPASSPLPSSPPKPCARPTSPWPSAPPAIAASTPSTPSTTRPPPSPATSSTPPPARSIPSTRSSSAGAGPCYISLDATGETAFVANYYGSSIATYRVLPNGALSEPVVRIDFKDPRFGHRGPVAARQDIPHRHSVHVSPDNRFLLVNDLGSDQISIFPIEPGARLGQPALFSNDRPGCGPRHIAFHPNGRWVYSINEIDSTIDHFLWTTTSSPHRSPGPAHQHRPLRQNHRPRLPRR